MKKLRDWFEGLTEKKRTIVIALAVMAVVIVLANL